MQPSSDFYGRRDISRTPRGCFVDTTNRPLNNNNNNNNSRNVVKRDLGIRVVGGKKLSNGDLGAFITMLDTSKAHETLGELREGDQILEWNGVLLGGKTFEEVERVIQASNLGEIELIVRSRRNLYDNGDELEDDEYRLNGADNECRGIYGGPGGENGGGEFGRQQRQTSTRKNIAFADSTKNGSNWHSPSEPPPIPAHRAQHNNHINTNQQQHQSSTTTDEWCAEIKWPPSSVLRRKGCGGGGTMPSPHSNDDGYGDGVGVEHVGGGGGGHASAGHLQVAIAYDRQNWVLSIRLIAAHGLATCGQELPNPFIKVYLLPERKVSNKRRTKYVPASCNPIWDQLVEYSIPPNQLERHYLELTVLDYDRHTVDMDSRIIGQVLVGLGDPLSLNGTPKWLALQCAPPVSALMRNCSPMDTHFQLPNRTYYNPAVLDLLDGYPAIA
uniref:C2 domain-containing protein n=1 Tax=Globodera pallida TaxID=36090 RepID=A0A183C4D0_GLOPA